MSARRHFRGFTLAELMVVIVIIAVMIFLFLPLLNQNRGDGRRARCQNNMKNIVLAIIGHANQKNVFPPSGMFMEDAETLAFLTPGSPTFGQGTGSVIPTYLPGQHSQRGVPMYSWVVPILANLDKQELFDQWTIFTNGPSGNPTAVAYDDPTNYVTEQLSNARIAEISFKLLQCPSDNSVQARRSRRLELCRQWWFRALARESTLLGWFADRWRRQAGCTDDVDAEWGRPDRGHSEARCDVHGVDFPAGSGECTADSLEREVYFLEHRGRGE